MMVNIWSAWQKLI